MRPGSFTIPRRREQSSEVGSIATNERYRHPWWIFRGSRTPPGLYARQKWLGEAHTTSWRKDFDRTVATLRKGQERNGLWLDSPLVTVQRLFGLHLTVREADAPIEQGLDALVDLASSPTGDSGDPSLAGEALDGLPFAPSRWPAFLLPATLFLSSIFGRADESRIRTLYERLLSPLTGGPVDDWPPADIHNTLRAAVVHPDYARHPATEAVVGWYAQRQTPHGDWGAQIPFYQALNALAHMESPAAAQQCRKALDTLPARRNADGSWGLRQTQWETFLATHALRNRGLLPRPPMA